MELHLYLEIEGECELMRELHHFIRVSKLLDGYLNHKLYAQFIQAILE